MAHYDTIGYYFYRKGVADLDQSRADELKEEATSLSKLKRKPIKEMSGRGGRGIPLFNTDILSEIFKNYCDGER